MEEKELWMNKLKEKLEDYSEPIPASGWEQLEKEFMPPVERKIYPYRKWFVIELSDTGIPFQAESLLQFGIQQLTTHKDSGGRGQI